MFNKTVIQKSPQSITTTHHEHRAPTDQSVQLLKELQQEAIASTILCSKEPFSASFTCRVVENFNTIGLTAYCTLYVNDIETLLTVDIDHYEFTAARSPKEQVIIMGDQIRAAVSEKLSALITKEILVCTLKFIGNTRRDHE